MDCWISWPSMAMARLCFTAWETGNLNRRICFQQIPRRHVVDRQAQSHLACSFLAWRRGRRATHSPAARSRRLGDGSSATSPRRRRRAAPRSSRRGRPGGPGRAPPVQYPSAYHVRKFADAAPWAASPRQTHSAVSAERFRHCEKAKGVLFRERPSSHCTGLRESGSPVT